MCTVYIYIYSRTQNHQGWWAWLKREREGGQMVTDEGEIEEEDLEKRVILIIRVFFEKKGPASRHFLTLFSLCLLQPNRLKQFRKHVRFHKDIRLLKFYMLAG